MSFLLALLLVIGAADAQEPVPVPPEAPSPARLCADAAEGSEIELCLRLAAEHPDDVDDIAAALRAHVDRSAEGDRELLAGLLLLLDDETAAEGARRLAELGDPRAVGPLAQAAETRPETAGVPSAMALGHFDAGLEPLSRWVTDKRMPDDVRHAAVKAIGEMGKAEGADVLITGLRSRGVPSDLRATMIETIETRYPDRASELERQVSQDGRWWLAGAGAWGLGYTLSFVGYLGQGNFEWLGGLTGGIAGGTAGYIIGRSWPMEAADASFITSNGVLGTASGMLIGSSITEDSEAGVWFGGFAGEVVGFSLGIGFRKLHRGTVVDTLEASTVGTMTSLAASTAAIYGVSFQFDGGSNSRAPTFAAGLGMLVGTGIGHALAPLVPLHGWDMFSVLIGASYGTAAGLLIPLPGDSEILGATGLGVGMLVGYGLSGPLEPKGDVVVGAFTGMAFGAVAGAGIGLLADPQASSDGSAWRAGALGGMTAGLAAGAFAAWREPEPLNGDDALFVTLVTGWSAWQAAGWYNYAVPPPSADGAFLLAPALVSSAFALTTPWVEVPGAWTFGGFSVGVFGGYIGGTVAQLTGAPGPRILLGTLIGSDLGLAAGFGLAVPPIQAPVLVVGLADAGGILGGALAALTATFFVDPQAPNGIDTILASSLGGLAVGIAGGAVLGVVLHKSGRARDVAWLDLGPVDLPGQWMVAPTVLAGDEQPVFGARIEAFGW